MIFKRRLRNVCGVLLGTLLVLFALSSTVAYVQGTITPPQYMTIMYLVVVVAAFFAYMVLYWGK